MTEGRQENFSCRDGWTIAKEVKKMVRKPIDESKLLERITIDPDICHGKP
jgi:hypothetical protein